MQILKLYTFYRVLWRFSHRLAIKSASSYLIHLLLHHKIYFQVKQDRLYCNVTAKRYTQYIVLNPIYFPMEQFSFLTFARKVLLIFCFRFLTQGVLKIRNMTSFATNLTQCKSTIGNIWLLKHMTARNI